MKKNYANATRIAFRELLLETLDKYEMFFYLKYRFALIKGDSSNDGYYYCQIYYTTSFDALMLVKSIVSDLEYVKNLSNSLKVCGFSE